MQLVARIDPARWVERARRAPCSLPLGAGGREGTLLGRCVRVRCSRVRALQSTNRDPGSPDHVLTLLASAAITAVPTRHRARHRTAVVPLAISRSPPAPRRRTFVRHAAQRRFTDDWAAGCGAARLHHERRVFLLETPTGGRSSIRSRAGGISRPGAFRFRRRSEERNPAGFAAPPAVLPLRTHHYWPRLRPTKTTARRACRGCRPVARPRRVARRRPPRLSAARPRRSPCRPSR